ncbi:MAG: hypothetical protein ABS75_23215 [Pelagibacterium sp. SCN 63-23]|nr:MAG: hypothetical protein ABS75_23215 [Pelagibacterium sp. SCN 63-23]
MSYESPAADDARIDVSALLSAVIRRLPRIVLVTVALLVATFVVLMFQPRLYESSASLLVEPRSNPYVLASNEAAPVSGGEAGVVSSQIELLKSRDTLLAVIDQLDLRSVAEFNGSLAGPSPLAMITQLMGRRSATPNSIDETVLSTLYERLTVVQERDSRIISVLVRSADPQLAAAIANAIANAHVARRAQLSLSDTADASGWLRAEIDRLRVSVQQAESAVADFKVSNDLFTGNNNTSLLDQQLSTVATQITAAQERKNTALSRAALIRGLIERNQPIDGVADVRESVIIQRLSEEKARLQGEHAQRSATLLANHPSIRSLNAQIAELDNQIRVEGNRVASALEAEAQIEANLEASLQADLARAKSTASTATMDNVTLDGLEREAKAQRDLLEAYLLRYNEASSRVETSSALPDVRVVSIAAPSVTPASPKTSLTMLAVGIVSFVLQVGVVIFAELMSGRALASVPQPIRPQDELDTTPFDSAELEPEQRWEEPEAEVDADAVTLEISEPELLPEPAAALYHQPVADDEPDPEAMRNFMRALMLDRSARSEDEADAEFTASTAEPSESAAEPELEQEADPAPRFELDNGPESAAATASGAAADLLRYSDLVADLVLGRTHLLLLADHGHEQPGRLMAEDLVGDALGKGLSVALIDAGTGVPTENPGLTDLSAGSASFGDVVQRSADHTFAEVTWGQGASIDQSSSRPLTLVEALGDIYEVVVVLTGRVNRRSMLGAFAELGGRIVLVSENDEDMESLDDIRRRLEEAGLARVEITALAESVAA